MEEKLRSIFIDPYSDFGFKKLFGEGSSPGILLDFLNAVLKLDRPIVQVEYIVTEQLGDLPDHRKSFFDVYCLDVDRNHFIIEVQQLKKPIIRTEPCFIPRSRFADRGCGETGIFSCNGPTRSVSLTFALMTGSPEK